MQEVGGINPGHIKGSPEISSGLKKRITELKNEKLKFYNNDATCQFHSVETLKHAERKLFEDILWAKEDLLDSQIKSLQRKLEGPQTYQIGLDGRGTPRPHQMDLEASKYRQEIESLTAELAQTDASHKALSTAPEVPFVWDIAFVEMFESEKDGFDVVIGNPPYVRQEAIADPRTPRDKVTAENKRVYKDKLARSVYQAFPRFFGYKAGSNTVAHKLDAKSDLYIYFYLHGLSLLNSKGSFCFITSNSWLDVGYGADLQEFLLKHSHVKLVLDNQAKRTFANADVNSIIALFSAPDDRREWALDKTARFVMFRMPFEHILSPVIFDEIEEATERKTTKEYRVFPIPQSKLLLEDGCEIPVVGAGLKPAPTKAGTLIKTAHYIGNKWGGKYLRAPEIYWTILKKGKFAKLSVVCTVEGYIHDNNTGAKYPKVPFLKSVKDLDQICVLKNANGIVNYGVKSEGNSRTVAPILFPRTFGSRHIVAYNPDGVFAKEFYKIMPQKENQIISIAAQLNSTFAVLQRELIGLVNLGDGALKFSADDIKLFYLLVDCESQDIERPFHLLSRRTILDIPADIMQDDRRALDDVIFDILDLTQGERDAVYEAAVNLVEARLKKARSG